jgi:hypothetical protein
VASSETLQKEGARVVFKLFLLELIIPPLSVRLVALAIVRKLPKNRLRLLSHNRVLSASESIYL